MVLLQKVDGVSVAAGNAKLMNRLGIALQECTSCRNRLSIWLWMENMDGHILISAGIIKPQPAWMRTYKECNHVGQRLSIWHILVLISDIQTSCSRLVRT